jgi:hypothetical protein
MDQSANITEKKFRKLSLMVRAEGFWYCVTDTLNAKVTEVKRVQFDKVNPAKVHDQYWKAFVDHTDLTRDYDEVVVIHDNALNTFVPHALFDEDFLGSYLQYNTKVFETDYFAFDDLTPYDMNNVYVPFVDINNFLIDHFGPFTYKNANSVLVQKLLERSKNNDDRQMFAHVAGSHFEIVVIQNQKLILFNSFEYSAPEDFLYYLLFTAEQLDLNPEHFRLTLLGDVTAESDVYKIAYDYVRNVSVLDAATDGLSAEESRRHFILTA